MYKQFISDNQRLVVLKAKLMHPEIFLHDYYFCYNVWIKAKSVLFLVYVDAVI
jgi:hypothetical protein